MENKKNKAMDINEMDKVSGGTAPDVSKGDLDILTPTIDITKPNNNGKVPDIKLGEKPTIIGDPTESMIK